MKKTITTLVLCFALLTTAMAAITPTATAPAAGDGSVGNPYQINTLDNLYWLSQTTSVWGSSFIQTANIDATATSSWDGGNGFSPIGGGGKDYPFIGKYNGQGFSISNLYINRPTTVNIGLFGVASNASLSHIALINVNITGNETIGALVGMCDNSTISYCYSTGTMNSVYRTIGGLIGYAGCTVQFSYSSCNVTGSEAVGGFIGDSNNSNINYCYATGNVLLSGSVINTYAGGFISEYDASSTGYSMTNCYAKGSVTNSSTGGLSYAGGFAGAFGGSEVVTVQKCYATGTVSAVDIPVGFVARTMGSLSISNCFFDTQTTNQTVAGYTGITGETSTAMKTLTTFTNAGWDFVNETTNGTTDLWDMSTTDGYPYLFPLAPSAVTNKATSITPSEATLNGTVNANGTGSNVRFEYGTSTSYGTTVTANQNPVAGFVATAVSYSLTSLMPNTIYHYRVSGTSFGGTTNGADSTFTTSAIAPSATTGSANNISGTTVALNGTVNANNATSIVYFEYGTSTSYGNTATAAQSPVTGTAATSVSYSLTGLIPNTIYHFRVKAVNMAGTNYGSDSTFTTSAIVPTATTSAAIAISNTEVTLNGSVNANNASTDVTFEYGTTTNYGSSVTADQSLVTGISATNVSYTLSGLIPNTTYHYRVVGVNTAGTTDGTDLSFTTSAIAPTATTSAATAISSTEATLNGSVNANNASTDVTFEYGTTTNYGNSVTADQSPVTGISATNVSYTLSGLIPNTTYHYRVVGVNTAGTTDGTDLSFTTSAIAPTATTSAATAISSTEATLNGSVNANNASTDVTFEYGTTTNYGSSVTADQSPVTGTAATAVSYSLTGLIPNTIYHFRVKAVNTDGTTDGSDSTFATSAIVPTAATNSPSSISSTAATLNGTVNPNNITTVVSFEYGTTTNYGNSVTADQSPVTGTSATNVSYTLSGLILNTTYHYRVVGVNTAGTTDGTDLSFTTSAIAPTATTSAATAISSTEATLNGSVNANNASTDVTFEYGTTTSYGNSVTANQSPVTGTLATNVSYTVSGLIPNTTYHYRVAGVNTAGTTDGTDLTFTTSKVAPAVTSQDVTNVLGTEATGNGTITVLGSPAPISHGVCWNTTGTPTVADAKIDSGAVSSTGAFTAAITGLTANTTYYVRAYAISVTDTVYGGTVSFSTTATGISTAETEKVILYPNPVKDAFQIGGINDKAVITVLDIKGKTLFTKEVSANESILASALPQGVYIVRITTDVGTVEQKIVKK